MKEILDAANQFKELGVTLVMLALYVYKDLKFWKDMSTVNSNITAAMAQNAENQKKTNELLETMAENQQTVAVDLAIIKERVGK
jgi:uncharacterized protein HemY